MVDLDRLINSEDRLNKYLDYLIEILASDYHYSFKDLNDKVEVIGNIYENKELLNETNR